MNETSVKAYARAYSVLARAFRDAGKPLPVSTIDKCSERPFDAFTPLYLRATREGLLGSQEEALLTAFLGEVDANDDLHLERPLKPELQGVWLLEEAHWREVYTPAQAAEKLGVTKQRISALMRDGLLEHVKLGGRYFISGASVNRRAREFQKD